MRGKMIFGGALLVLATAGCGRAGSQAVADPSLGFVQHDNAVSPPAVDGGYARPGDQNCGVVWTASADGSWRRGRLGCDDAPNAVTTLADGRVVVVGREDVWVRA